MITDSSLRRPGADVLAAALARLPGPTADALRRIGQLRHWNDGDVVLRGGDAAGAALLVLDGRLRLAATSAEGDEVLFRWIVPGEYIGIVSVLGELPLPTEAVAVGRVEAAQFDRERLLEHLRHDAEGALYFAGVVSRYAAQITQLLVSQTSGSLEARIASVLERLASHEAEDAPLRDVKLMLSHQDIAHAVGASRQRVSVELRKLEQRGRIRLGYRHLVVLHAARPDRETPAA